MHDFVFVLEQTLGHVAHGQNLERVIHAQDAGSARFIRVEFNKKKPWHRMPGVGTWSFRASWEARRRLNRELEERPADCIFMHTQVVALMATDIMRRVPTVVSLDATPLNFDRLGQAYSHKVGNPVFEAVKFEINRRAFASAAGLITWCKWAAASLGDDYGVIPEKIRVIPPGVDVRMFSPGNRRPGGPPRLLFVGGDFERKGGLDLLEALKVLGRSVEVDIVTRSSVSRPPLSMPVRFHVGLTPHSPDLVRLFREADIFVLPTRGDCFPQVVAEAMACALPVVATNVGAISEMVGDGSTGLLVAPGAPSQLARAIATLVDDQPRREAMGNAGLHAARRDHDMVRNNSSILSFMSELSATHSLAVRYA